MANQFEKKVLLIDLDPQMNATCVFSSVDFFELFKQISTGKCIKIEKCVEDLFLEKNLDIHECIHKTRYKNLEIIPAFLTLQEAEEKMRANVRMPQQFHLKRHLMEVQDEYDYCIIDAKPGISILDINGLVAADEVYIPLRCDAGSILGISATINLLRTVEKFNGNLKIGGMFFTKWNNKETVSKVVYDLLKEMFSEYVLPITIRSSNNIEEASLVQMPLLAYDSGKNKSGVTQDYIKLTEYILTK